MGSKICKVCFWGEKNIDELQLQKRFINGETLTSGGHKGKQSMNGMGSKYMQNRKQMKQTKQGKLKKKSERNTINIFPLHACILCRLPQISDALSFVKEILQQLNNQKASIEEDIQSSFEDLHKQLDVRKSVLLMELEVTYGLKQKVQTTRIKPHLSLPKSCHLSVLQHLFA